VIAGQEVFWPTRERIYAFDVASGQQTREPIDIGPLTSVGANLVAADGWLLVVGQDRMTALGPKPAPKPQPQETDVVETVAVY
jgi:hypothetical protein